MTTISAECHVNLNPLVELVEEEEKELTKRKQRKDDKPGIGGCEVAAILFLEYCNIADVGKEEIPPD